MNWQRVFHILGAALIGFSLTMALPAGWAVYFHEWHSLQSFAISFALTCGIGSALFFGAKTSGSNIYRREALLVVSASWFLIPLFASIPFLLEGVFTSPIDAFFEMASGFSTTGATVLTEIENSMTRSVHFWRLQSHWLGGMGIMVLFVAVLPSLGVGGKQLFKHEVPGPITEGLKPKIRETSKMLWQIYITLTIAETLLLWAITPMDLHEASAHAMSTLGTGGFSTLNASVAGFNSASVDYIITIFMFLAGINFSLYFLVIQGRWKIALKDAELQLYTVLTVVSSLIVTWAIFARHGHVFATSFRYAIFQVVSIITTTGFGTDDFDAYPPIARNLIFLLLFIGGSAGSTAGGLKIFRLIVLFKIAHAQALRTFRPQSIVPIRIANRVIPDDIARSIAGFFFAYIALFAVGTFFMSMMTIDLESAMSSTIACLGNIGPGLSQVGPTQNYSSIPDAGKLLLSFLMIAGRLELYTFLVVFAPAFWRR